MIDNLDVINNLKIKDILELNSDDNLWKEYQLVTDMILEKHSSEVYRYKEFNMYDLIVDNVVLFILNHKLNTDPVSVCGFLSSLIYGEDTWFYTDRTFTYDDDSESLDLLSQMNDTERLSSDIHLIEKKNYIENSLISNRENFLYYGAEVVRGRGCCRHLSAFFYDVLRKLNYEVYKVGNSLNFVNEKCESLIPLINNRYDIFIEENNESLDKCRNNHMSIIFKMNDTYIMFDPTNMLFSKVNGEITEGFDKSFKSVIGFPSITRYNGLTVEQVKELYNKFKNSKDIDYDLIMSSFKNGIDGLSIVDDNTVDRHQNLYKLMENHFANRVNYQMEFALNRIYNKTLR